MAIEELIIDVDLQLPPMADLSNDTIISTNNNGIITGWNLVAENTFGYTRRQAIG